MATTTLLVLKGDFFRHMNMHWSGTLTGGSTEKAADTALTMLASETFPTPVKGRQMRITSGAALGDIRLITDFDGTDGVMEPHRPFSAAVANAVTYELWGNAIYGGQPLTDLFNDVLRRMRPVRHTQISPIVTNQRRYDVTALVTMKRDIRRVYRRDLDQTTVEPYRTFNLGWTAEEFGGGGTTGVYLWLDNSLTLNAATTELWVEHEGPFTAFSSDTSTIDAVYRDWLSWECVLAFAEKMMESTTAQEAEWRKRRDRAVRELNTLRARFYPREPIRIKATRS
jgi:hypothetical protein